MRRRIRGESMIRKRVVRGRRSRRRRPRSSRCVRRKEGGKVIFRREDRVQSGEKVMWGKREEPCGKRRHGRMSPVMWDKRKEEHMPENRRRERRNVRGREVRVVPERMGRVEKGRGGRREKRKRRRRKDVRTRRIRRRRWMRRRRRRRRRSIVPTVAVRAAPPPRRS